MDLTANFSIPIPFDPRNQRQGEAAFTAVDNALLASLALPHAPELDSPNISIPAMTSVDIGLNVRNVDTTAGNISAIAFSNAAGYQAQAGVVNIGPGATAGGEYFIATREAGKSALAERVRWTHQRMTLTVQAHQEENHSFFENDVDPLTGLPKPALINRWGGRSFFGAAIQNTLGTRDWSEAMRMNSPDANTVCTGTVNVSGVNVTRVSGDLFATAAANFSTYSPLVGFSIAIAGVRYTIASVTDSSHLTLKTSAGSQVGASYVIGLGMIQSGGAFVVSALNDPLNPASQHAIFAAATTVGANSFGYGSYGLCAVAVNNSPLWESAVWGVYIEAHRMSATVAWAVGIELDVVNRGEAVVTSPYNSYHAHNTEGLQLGCGAGLSPIGQTNCTSAINIFSNSGALYDIKWNAGIKFSQQSIAASGPGGSIPAIQLPLAFGVLWYNNTAGGTDTLGGSITTDGASRMQLTASAGVEIRAANALVNSVRNHFSLISSTAYGIDVGPQMQFVGYNGSGGGSDPQAFATLAGRKENATSSNWAGYFQIATTNAAGTIAEAARFTSGKVFALLNGTAPSLIAGQAQMWTQNITSILSGGTGVNSESLGSQLRILAKGVSILSHASIGVDADVDQIIGGGYPSTALVVKRIFGTPASPSNFAAADSATGFGVAKRQGIQSWIQTCSSGDVGGTNEVSGIRSLVTETSTGNHTGKFYGGTFEMDSAGTGRHALIRGGYALLAKGGPGTWGDGKAFLALFQNYAGSSGLMDLVDVGAFEWNLDAASNFTQANGIRTRLSVSANMTCADFRNIRVSAPNITGSPTLAITKMTGVSIADLSGITGVASAFNFYSEGANSQHGFEGALVLGGAPLEADTAPISGLIRGQMAYSLASTNTTGGDILLTGGTGKRVLTSLVNSAGGVTITIAVNGTAVSLVSGISFNLGSSDLTAQLIVTATNLAAAINANSTLNTKVYATNVVATVATVNVHLRAKGGLYSLSIATNQAGRISATSADDGGVRIPLQVDVSANFGALSVGNGPFDGSTSGFFTGSASGTHLAVNAATGFAGDFAHFQLAGVNRFSFSAAGVLTQTSHGDSVKFNLDDATSYVQYGFFEAGAKKAAISYAGLSSSGFIGGAGALAIGTLNSVPVALFTNGTERFRITGDGAVRLQELSATPAAPAAGTECQTYMKGDKFIIEFNDAGTVRWKYLDLTGTGITWVHSTTAP